MLSLKAALVFCLNESDADEKVGQLNIPNPIIIQLIVRDIQMEVQFFTETCKYFCN